MDSALIGNHGSWKEEAGEVELIGGWTEVALTDAFAAQIDTSDYQVFLTSYDAVLVFVQNRRPRSFEIHAAPVPRGKRATSMRCAYRVVARRLHADDPRDDQSSA